jgi:hypothetical protein
MKQVARPSPRAQAAPHTTTYDRLPAAAVPSASSTPSPPLRALLLGEPTWRDKGRHRLPSERRHVHVLRHSVAVYVLDAGPAPPALVPLIAGAG